MTLMGSWGEEGGENDQETVLSKFWISTTLLAPSMDAERESRWRLTPFACYIIQICRGKNARVNFKGAKKSKSSRKHSSRFVPIFRHPLSRFPPPSSILSTRGPASCNPFSIRFFHRTGRTRYLYRARMLIATIVILVRYR